MNRVEEILLFDDLDAGIDDLERLVDEWRRTVVASLTEHARTTLLAPAIEHVRVTFLSEQPPPQPETLRLVGFTQELGEEPVYVDEFIEGPPA